MFGKNASERLKLEPLHKSNTFPHSSHLSSSWVLLLGRVSAKATEAPGSQGTPEQGIPSLGHSSPTRLHRPDEVPSHGSVRHQGHLGMAQADHTSNVLDCRQVIRSILRRPLQNTTAGLPTTSYAVGSSGSLLLRTIESPHHRRTRTSSGRDRGQNSEGRSTRGLIGCSVLSGNGTLSECS
ncbi:hypothetical protein E4U59_001672 [Claviceps monticola]|nr:hypothetical protein E4U59_001672 [Claviceps monticola]